MIHQQAKIFLADQRGLSESGLFQRRFTFNFGCYYNENKFAFGEVYALNDDILAGGASIQSPVEKDACLIIIPVAGAVCYKDSLENEYLVAAGQSLLVKAAEAQVTTISNPFSTEFVNLIQLFIRVPATTKASGPLLYNFADVNENLNSLVIAIAENMQQEPTFVVSIGKFSGRGETVYQQKFHPANLFIFVIEGAFEVEGRLLHARDGLALWQTSQLEMEALSNDAILMVIEMPASATAP